MAVSDCEEGVGSRGEGITLKRRGVGRSDIPEVFSGSGVPGKLRLSLSFLTLISTLTVERDDERGEVSRDSRNSL